jgi:flagellar biosynthetic protein FlhB
MSDKDQRTEQPTQQRLKKAREEGRFAVSKELVAAVQFAVFASLLTGMAGAWWPSTRATARELLLSAFRLELNPVSVQSVVVQYIVPLGVVLGISGMLMMGASLLTQLAVTGFGLASSRLSPDITRLNPVSNLRELPRRNRGAFLEASVMLPVMLAVSWAVISGRLDEFLRLPLSGIENSVRVLGGAFSELLWKATVVFLAWGAFDLFRQKQRYTKDLRMTKQEIREEFKQNEGSPEIKAKIRRLRRELLRRRMMSEVPSATAVIVNPTHFAVALRYNMQTMPAPKVVAKGKNYLALRIRQKALDHQVPVIENPPLAQALYKNVEVGQDIPAALYRAVAEVLAYVFRMMNGNGGKR